MCLSSLYSFPIFWNSLELYSGNKQDTERYTIILQSWERKATVWGRIPLYNRLKSDSHWRHNKLLPTVNATLFEKQNRSLKRWLKTLSCQANPGFQQVGPEVHYDILTRNRRKKQRSTQSRRRPSEDEVDCRVWVQLRSADLAMRHWGGKK